MPVRNLFWFLHEIFDLSPESIIESSNRLDEAYPEDLVHDLADKLVCTFVASPAAAAVSVSAIAFTTAFRFLNVLRPADTQTAHVHTVLVITKRSNYNTTANHGN